MYKNPMTIINSWVPHSNNYAYIVNVLADMCCIFVYVWPSWVCKIGIKISRTAVSTDNTQIQTVFFSPFHSFVTQKLNNALCASDHNKKKKRWFYISIGMNMKKVCARIQIKNAFYLYYNKNIWQMKFVMVLPCAMVYMEW